MTPTPPARDRSADVKRAIRHSARALFTERGFDTTGIRDIATDAGVNPAIVIRHFGSKEQLFLETVDVFHEWEELFHGDVSVLGRQVVEAVLKGRGNGLGIFGTTVRALGKPDIHERFSGLVTTMLVAPVEERLPQPDAATRAHLFTAQLIGLLTALTVYNDSHLLALPDEELIERYGDILQTTLTGSAPSTARHPDTR